MPYCERDRLTLRIRRNMTSRLCAGALLLVACGGVADPGGSGGTSSSAGAAGATAGGGATDAGASGAAGADAAGADAGGTGGAEPQPGYDRVIGCSAIEHTARVVFFEPETFFRTSAISGDGRVVAGYFAEASSWSVEAGLELLGAEVNRQPQALSCDGSVALLYEPETHAVERVQRGEAAQEVMPASEQTSTPLALSPDGGAIVVTLDGGADLGPRPTLWTRALGVQLLEPLVNTLVYRVANDARWLVGRDVRRLYRYEPGVGKTEPWPAFDVSAGLAASEPIVSADGNAYAWADATSSGFRVQRNGEQVRAPCPSGYCFPVAISGTGKVVAVYEAYGSWPRTLLLTENGFQNLQELLERHGAPLGARTLQVTAMSDDGQAFTGRSYDTETFEERAFYATLPRAAYE